MKARHKLFFRKGSGFWRFYWLTLAYANIPACSNVIFDQDIVGFVTHFNDRGVGHCGESIDASTQCFASVSIRHFPQTALASAARRKSSTDFGQGQACNDICIQLNIPQQGRTLILPLRDKCSECTERHLEISEPAFMQLDGLETPQVDNIIWRFIRCESDFAAPPQVDLLPSFGRPKKSSRRVGNDFSPQQSEDQQQQQQQLPQQQQVLTRLVQQGNEETSSKGDASNEDDEQQPQNKKINGAIVLPPIPLKVTNPVALTTVAPQTSVITTAPVIYVPTTMSPLHPTAQPTLLYPSHPQLGLPANNIASAHSPKPPGLRQGIVAGQPQLFQQGEEHGKLPVLPPLRPGILPSAPQITVRVVQSSLALPDVSHPVVAGDASGNLPQALKQPKGNGVPSPQHGLVYPMPPTLDKSGGTVQQPFAVSSPVMPSNVVNDENSSPLHKGGIPPDNFPYKLIQQPGAPMYTSVAPQQRPRYTVKRRRIRRTSIKVGIITTPRTTTTTTTTTSPEEEEPPFLPPPPPPPPPPSKRTTPTPKRRTRRPRGGRYNRRGRPKGDDEETLSENTRDSDLS